MSVAAREQRDAAKNAAADQRERAFTLFANAYDQVHRAATYLHWGESIDHIAPSIYTGAAAHKAATAATAPADTKAGDKPAASPATPGNGAAQPTPGMPGTSPFTAPGA